MSSTEHDSDYGYTSRFRPIEKNAIGARAIIVQDIPDGVLGRPVEFESEFLFGKYIRYPKDDSDAI